VGHSQLTIENLLKRKKNAGVDRVLIIGAGSAGEQLLREIKNNPAMAYDVVGFVDDDARHCGSLQGDGRALPDPAGAGRPHRRQGDGPQDAQL
jgi:FlaA1/EpsC-like NDP-sugar epimerase